jgi:DNA-binding response OmpR family regulator
MVRPDYGGHTGRVEREEERRKARILVVDDEESLLELVTMGLRYEGFDTAVADSGAVALRRFREVDPHLVILDWMLPDRDGLQVCKDLRSTSDVPILMLTARGDLDDKVLGLESGADDYLPKPFKFRELLARVRALLRRAGADQGRYLSFTDLIVDPAARTATHAGRRLDLTRREFELLELFIRRPRHVFTRAQILDHLWGWEFEGDTNVVEVHVSALRAKLGDEGRRLIRTVRGIGYALGGA